MDEADGRIRSYRDLRVWQSAMKLVTEVYQASKRFPRDEVYALTSQIRRCAVSIPSNIAEGYGRNSTSDYVRFLRTAMGSLYELQTQMQISLNLGYLDQAVFEMLNDKSCSVARMLGSLISRVEDSRAARATPTTNTSK
jgi:four helix bundle protein